jgi:1,4-dihydroxy-2-naphthoate polyprenyltransferase
MFTDTIRIWLRVVRVRFLLASIISVSIGLALASLKGYPIDPMNALLTYIGVIALHASVDLLNDYWDYRTGIDKVTRRTKFSGGTGVLPENLLRPESVYIAGIVMLIIGAVIGVYFSIIKGVTIALILAFAVITVYLYSTSIVRLGLGEVFVAIKGTMIVLGTYYVQSSSIDIEPIYIGVISGMLSSIVLFVNSFPDYNADKAGGRRTLVIILGLANAARLFILFPALIYLLILVGVITSILPIYVIATFLALPYALTAYRVLLRTYCKSKDMSSADKSREDNIDVLVFSMKKTVTFSRILGMIILISLIIGIY